MAYDPISRKVVLFGGYDYNAYLNETWVFDGTWKKVNTPVAPSGRAAANMAFDYVSKKLVLFGGYNGQYLRETWLWDGATMQWTQAHPLNSPRPVTGPAVFTDPRTKTVTTFGGFDGRFYQLQTWRWRNGTWNRLNPANVPTARGAMVAAYDLARNSAVIFAGLADINPYNTWTWNGTDWTRQLPSEQPPYRYFAGATYDPRFNAVICFGGGLSGADLNDTWAWNGTDWLTVPLCQELAAEFHQVPLVHLRGPVHREARRLVEDQNPVVLVEDVELRPSPGQERRGLAALLDGHGVVQAEQRVG